MPALHCDRHGRGPAGRSCARPVRASDPREPGSRLVDHAVPSWGAGRRAESWSTAAAVPDDRASAPVRRAAGRRSARPAVPRTARRSRCCARRRTGCTRADPSSRAAPIRRSRRTSSTTPRLAPTPSRGTSPIPTPEGSPTGRSGRSSSTARTTARSSPTATRPSDRRSTAASRPRRMGARSDRTAGPSPSSRRAGGQARTGRGEARRRPADRPSFRRSAARRRSPAAVRRAALPKSHQSPGPGATAAPVPAPAPWPAGRSRPRRGQRRADVPRPWNTRPWHSLRAPRAMIAIRRTPTRLGTRSPVSVARISAQLATRANQPAGRR